VKDWPNSCSGGRLESEAILSAHSTKVPEGRSDADIGCPESVLTAFEIGHELAVLNSYHRLKIQALHNRCQVQIMDFAKLPRTQPVVAILSRSVVCCAEWHGRSVR